MKRMFISIFILLINTDLYALTETELLNTKVEQLQQQTQALQSEIQKLKSAQNSQATTRGSRRRAIPSRFRKHPAKAPAFHVSNVQVDVPNGHPDSLEFYPTALLSDNQVVTYIAGTPVVTAPYLGNRPAFDGSDYIVNISSINRDLRLMQQRRRLYREYRKLGYPEPDVPIIALSGKVEPVASFNQPYVGANAGTLTIGSSELDVSAAMNDLVQGFIGFSYTPSSSILGVPRVANSGVALNMGFVNIGNLDKSPIYFTGGQLYVPFGRFSTSMISPTLPMLMGRTKSRPFILGYKSQSEDGPFAAIYGFQGDTILDSTGVGGVNLGYVFNSPKARGEVGVSYISSIDNAGGMQLTGSNPGTTFGGFASITNGSEVVKKIQGVDVHGYVNIDRYSLTAEWLSSLSRFRQQDLSYQGLGATPQAGQVEAAATFVSFSKPSSFAIGYQWSRDALALNLPHRRWNTAFSISIWKDTVESIEYRHDWDYKAGSFANGAPAIGHTNVNTLGTGSTANTLLAQIGVYF